MTLVLFSSPPAVETGEFRALLDSVQNRIAVLRSSATTGSGLERSMQQFREELALDLEPLEEWFSAATPVLTEEKAFGPDRSLLTAPMLPDSHSRLLQIEWLGREINRLSTPASAPDFTLPVLWLGDLVQAEVHRRVFLPYRRQAAVGTQRFECNNDEFNQPAHTAQALISGWLESPVLLSLSDLGYCLLHLAGPKAPANALKAFIVNALPDYADIFVANVFPQRLLRFIHTYLHPCLLAPVDADGFKRCQDFLWREPSKLLFLITALQPVTS